jgi:hypothetical protein
MFMLFSEMHSRHGYVCLPIGSDVPLIVRTHPVQVVLGEEIRTPRKSSETRTAFISVVLSNEKEKT